jgi:type I restriction enzyme S subunit
MSELPRAWASATLGEIADTKLGKMLSAKARNGSGGRPYLRNKNVQWGRIDIDDVLRMGFSEDEFEKFRLREGDLLVCEGGEVGRAAIWRAQLQECAYQKALHRVRPRGGIAPEYLLYLLMHYAGTRAFDRYVTGSTIAHLPQEDLRELPVPLPPLAEQRRIVAAIEEQLSRLDSVANNLERARQRTNTFRRAALAALPEDAPRRPISDVVDKNIGGTWGSAAGHSEIDVQVIRVTEFRGHGVIDPSTAATRGVTHAQLASRRLIADDLLLEKSGGSTDRPVGRVGWVPDLAGDSVPANFIQLLRVNPRAASARYVFYWLMRLHALGVAERYQRATTNIRNLKTQDYLREEIPVPEVETQERLASRLDEVFLAADRLETEIRRALDEEARLRRSILANAFRGGLVPHNPRDEPASALLERIAAERESPTNVARGRRRGAKAI